ncbi:MAG TPA: hypothetical protein VFQ61_20115, partial [Polyangiaceae bacterium]|nr:hypothetical protein [Polyangiaceae bacterium]
ARETPEATPASPDGDPNTIGLVGCVPPSLPVVFTSLAGLSPDARLYLMQSDGRGRERIGPAGNFQQPVWSPDGKAIAVRFRNPTNGVADWHSEIRLLSPDGSQGVTLFTDESDPEAVTLAQRRDGPSWSPDGQWIGFASPKGGQSWAAWRVSRSGGEPQLLLPGVELSHYDVSWSPRSLDTVAMIAESDGIQDLYLVRNLKSPSLENLTQGRVTEPRLPRWSHDGLTLAIVGGDPQRAPSRDVFAVEVEGHTLMRVTQTADYEVDATWSPSGTELLSAAQPPGVSSPPRQLDLWMISAEQARPARRVTENQGSNWGADWFRGCESSEREQ